MSKQKKKYNLGMAGEYYVAAELHRRGVHASLTYGNAKKADVVALSNDGDRASVVEVKTTAQPKWVIGQRVPEPCDLLWVFVHLPKSQSEVPRFFVLTQREIHEILDPLDREYRRKYKATHGQDYGDKPGVTSITLKQIEAHEAAWNKIVERL